MYAEDNRGKLVFNRDGGNAGGSSGSECWVAGWLDFTSSTANTNTATLVNHDLYPYGAYLGPYVKTPRAFKCPADKSVVSIAGRSLPRVRSVSMNDRVGQGSRSWLSPSAFLLYPTMSAISSPTPSRLFVFTDEHESSINDGCFFVDPDTAGALIDYPASHHNSGGAFGFADGHSEIHLWRDSRTIPPFQPGQLLPLNIILRGDVDIQWLQEHSAARR